MPDMPDYHMPCLGLYLREVTGLASVNSFSAFYNCMKIIIIRSSSIIITILLSIVLCLMERYFGVLFHIKVKFD